MALLESVTSALHVLLLVLGVLVLIIIQRVYALLRTMKISKTVMTPMLFAGLVIVLQGITELTELFLGEIAHVLHAGVMSVGAVLFLYGIYNYYRMLKGTSKPTE